MRSKARESMRKPVTSQPSPKLRVVENPTPSLEARLSPSNMRNVVAVTVSVRPRNARRE